MNIRKYNNEEIAIIKNVQEQLQWLLGEELHADPSTTPEGRQEVEMRLATWLLSGGGAWLRNIDQVNQHLTK